MKTITRLFSQFVTLLLFSNGAMAADVDSSPRLTVELRDGSRIIGQSMESEIKLHSVLFGDFKLRVKDIRSLDSSSTNAVMLSTVSGDTLAVSFLDPELDIKATFGKVEIPVNSIRELMVAGRAYETTLPGLVSFWSGDDEGKDSVGNNDATTMGNLTFENQKSGHAFGLDGHDAYMKVSASPSLDIAAGGGFTITAWIQPADVSGIRWLFEWDNMTDRTLNEGSQVTFRIGHSPGSYGQLWANIVDNTGTQHDSLESPPGVLAPSVPQYIALTYDKTSGMGILYVNGVAVAKSALGNFTPLTAGDFWIGYCPRQRPGTWDWNRFYIGLLDKVALYNRPLTAEEIKSICLHDNSGVMPPPPVPRSTYMQPVGGLVPGSM